MTMIAPLLMNEDPSIQENLYQLSIQLEHPLDRVEIDKLYQDAKNLLSHIDPGQVTLARVAGVLLVYRIQDSEAEEIAWFKDQIEQCTDDEEVEEMIESLHRIDTL
jgi:anthranilate phosphoribosyltransferase